MAVLGFITEFPEEFHYIQKKSYFQEKILTSMFNHSGMLPANIANNPSLVNHMIGNTREKIHTIRKKGKRKIKEGTLLHMSINVRKPDQRQFAPIVKCTGVEQLEIIYNDFGNTAIRVDVKINGHYCGMARFLGGVCVTIDPWFTKFIHNDGFDDIRIFFKMFNESGVYDLIHWTDRLYSKEFQNPKNEK